MRRKIPFALGVLLLALAGASLLAGCSLIGLAIGWHLDASKPTHVTIPGWKVDTVTRGARITVFLRDGKVLSGKYLGLQPAEGHPEGPEDTIAIRTEEGKGLVPTADVYQITVKTKKHGALIGFLAGAAVDLIVVGAAAAAIERSDVFEMGSCPFVYSFDGRRYHLESEAFAGAIFEAAQRTDWARLDHLTEFEGTCHLKITNELRETQHIDQLRLLAIDHPRGTRVVPSPSGRLHVLSSLVKARRAADLEGNDILELVAAKDDRVWLSNPFGRRADIRAQLRDGVILEFARPERADSVKLFLNLRNTLWATHVETRLLKLYGARLRDWYALMNGSARAREGFLEAVAREAALRIGLWDGEAWKPSGVTWFVGSHVPRDQVIRLDLRGIPGDALRVRLDASAGLWMIDTVQADYTADVRLHTAELSPCVARASDESDLAAILAEIDERRYVMPTPRDSAVLLFRAPPPRREHDRSFVLKSTGYYEIHVPAQGDPQWAVLSSLARDPDAFGRYNLRTLEQDVTSALAHATWRTFPLRDAEREPR